MTLLRFFGILFLSHLLLNSVPTQASQLLPLFVISKDVNGNILHYEAQLEDNCRLNYYYPVKIYWEMENKTTEGLNFFEQGLYTFDFDSKSSDLARGQIKAFKSRNIPLTFEVRTSKDASGHCQASANISGSVIESVRLTDFSGRSPKRIVISERESDGKEGQKEFKF